MLYFSQNRFHFICGSCHVYSAAHLGRTGHALGVPAQMLAHFFKSLSDAAKMNLYIKAEGDNEHHKAEGIFKAIAKAIKMAIKRDVYQYNLPTTKGKL